MKGRPAESASGAAALGSLLAVILGVRDEATLAAMITGIGLLPAVVSLVYDKGGIRGVLRGLWRGRDATPSPPG